jgi:hypothetical protein
VDNKDFPTQDDISEAIHKLITQFPGKYSAMAKELDPVAGTENALRNRVRQVSGQVVPLGMAVEMESISGRSDITEAMCKHAGGVFVKLPEIEQADTRKIWTSNTRWRSRSGAGQNSVRALMVRRWQQKRWIG